jgi:uncharacterized protein (DUF1684 family)
MLASKAAVPSTDSGYRAEIEKWRVEREERLTSEYGWLSVSGLYWLEPGVHSFGRDPQSDLVLPTHAPLRAGVFERRDDAVTVKPEPGIPMTIDGTLVSGETPLTANGTPLKMGALQLQLIKRGDRLGLRVKDPANALRREFKGLRWFPVQDSWRLVARWVPYDKPHTLPITNVLGQTTEEPSPGYAEWTQGGQTLRLVPIYEDDDRSQLFFILKDKTAPSQTYGGGRFLYADPPKDGTVVLDFNKAVNPPCAFNPYTTCPMAPKENQLPIEIRAGEMKYPTH